MPDADVYSHGHHESVLRSHRWRTAENSAAYLLPHLTADDRLLDLGCGPGTITVDLATRVRSVRGIDASDDVIAAARAAAAERRVANVEFAVGNAYGLDDDAGSVDVVHAHQMLQHLGDPIGALREARRVLRPGGLLAVRDADYGAFCWAPADPRLDRWLQLYHLITERNGVQADAGRWLPTWVHAAGFTDVEVSSSTWTFATPEDRRWWGTSWAERIRSSAYGEQAVEYGLSDETELAELAAAFEAWADEPAGLFVVVHVEVLARSPAA